ncbi:cell growth regulator with EF hand domain protein 1 [Ctenodactylus gundi]
MAFEMSLPGRMVLWMMRVAALLLLPVLAQAAPKDGAARPDPEVEPQLLPNPFQPGPEHLRLLQKYLKERERMEEDPEQMDREQVLLYLFALHDYDQSGQLDGLELLSMLTAALAPGAADFPVNPVILVVDRVLSTQDLNGDGLLTPAELISFPGKTPRHMEPTEPLVPGPQEPQAGEEQPLLAKSPWRQDTRDTLGPGEQAEDQVAGHQTGAEEDIPSSKEEARGQVEAEGDAPGPGGEAEGQAEARDNGEEAKVLPGETLESKNIPNQLEAHSIQLENDEM